MLNLEKFKNSDTYQIRLIHPNASIGQGGVVIGWLAAPIVVATASSWSNAAEQRFAGGKIDAAMQWATGRSLTSGAFTYQKWQGPQPVNVSFELAYVATRNAFDEVVKPVRELMKFPLPPEFSAALLKPPVDPFGEVCFASAKWFIIPDLLPESTQPQFSHVLSRTGHPTSATVTVSFLSKRAVTVKDVEGWFKG